jgi:serine/threonine protein kinase
LRAATAVQYLVHERLGAGGMGVVHRGTMVSLAGRRRVAIKRLWGGCFTAEQAPAQLIAEAQLVFQLTHANVCQVLDLAHSDDGTFVVMEFVDGLDLRTLVADLRKRGRRLDLASALHIAREVARALDYAHRRTDDAGRCLWLVHGDVTPQNVLLSREGEVKLADFGIARALGTLAPGNTLRGGTPGYVAPEVAGGVDQRSDIYSLGVTLYAALGGTTPEAGLDLEGLCALNGEVTPGIAAVLSRATATRPEKRYASASEMEQALGSLTRMAPLFSPSMLGQLVREIAGAPRVPHEDSETKTTLVSIASLGSASTGSASQNGSVPQTNASTSHPQGPKRTKRVERRSPARRLVLTVCGLGLAAAGIAAMWRPMPSSRAMEAALAAKTGPTVTTAAQPSIVPAADDVARVAPQVKEDVPRRTLVPRVPPKAKKSVVSSGLLENGFVTVNAYPWGAVFIDGKRAADQTPIYRLPVASGTHRIHVTNPERHVSSPDQIVDVRPGQTAKVGFHW